jgi:hypothetical protein
VLKKALRLQKSFTNPEKVGPEELDDLAALIVLAFGDRFTIEQVDNGANVNEMITVMQQIIARAGFRMQEQQAKNPTLPPGQEK